MTRCRREIAGGLSALLALALIGVSAQPDPVVQPDSVPDILVSRQLAAAEHLFPDDVVWISADPEGSGARRFRIAGIYEPTPDPMRLAVSRLEARLHLPDLIDLSARAPGASQSDPESVTTINVALKDPTAARAVARELSRRIPVPALAVRVARGEEGSAGVFVVLERFHQAIAIVTVLASTVFLLALMVITVEERRQTVGILRLIGLRRGRVLLQVVLEGLLVSMGGVLIGVLLAVAMQGVVNVFFQWRYDTALIFVQITPRIVLQCALVAVPLGVVAALVSSWTLLRSGALELAGR